MLLKTIADGSALHKLRQMVEAQGGDASAVLDTSLLPQAPVVIEALSQKSGYVQRIEAEDVGLVSMHLGGGRATKESDIDLSVGVVLSKKVGDYVKAGESLGSIHAPNMKKAEEAAELLRGCFTLAEEKAEGKTFIKAIVR